MIKNKTHAKRFLSFLLFSITAVILGRNNAFAEQGDGIVTDGNDIKWEYRLGTDNGEQALFIRFYDKPSDLATVTVPSLEELVGLVPGAPSNLDTYILEDSQGDEYSGYTRRTATVDTTKLDMSNTAKIQVRGVLPIINPDVETELVFGSDMVIGDTWHKRVIAYVCGEMNWDDWSDGYRCDGSHEVTFEGFESSIDGWDSMSFEEKAAYEVMPEDLGYKRLPKSVYYLPADQYDPSANYINMNWSYDNSTPYEGGAFSGYKLKLTNFDAANFNYVGYEAFKDSTLNDENTTITVNGDSLMGSKIFAGTNVKKAIINTDNYGAGMFEGCEQLTEYEFGSGATRVVDDTFKGTGLTSLDFSNTGIKRIGARAFQNAKLTDVNFEGVERIDYSAFENNDIKEIYLPKSINYLQSNIFYGNKNMKKATVAYDTLTSGTTLPFFVVLEGYYRGENSNSPATTLEELVVLAPYADGEEVSPTHVTYDDYRWHYDGETQEHIEGDVRIDHSGGSSYSSVNYTYYDRLADELGLEDEGTYKFEDDYANVDSYKNVVAPIYFMSLHNVKKITVGDGFEFIGSSAFWNMSNRNDNGNWWKESVAALNEEGQSCPSWSSSCWNSISSRRMEEINLPEGLKGVGNQAFESNWGVDIKTNLPDSLEFIGIAAFNRVWQMDLDFDLPNIKYLGDYAFHSTMLRNITLHDSIRYMGNHVFTDIPTIENITIDFDIFNPDLMVTWVDPDKDYDSYSIEQTYNRETGRWEFDPVKTRKKFQNYFKKQFGEWYGFAWSYSNQEDIDRWGIKRGYSELDSAYHQKFNKITFTEKAVHEIPCTDYEYDYDLRDNYTLDVFFGYVIADEIDLSATPWKVIPRNAFMQAKIDTIKLPENLEVISHHAFNATEIKNELVIPDSVRIIGDRAFESARLKDEETIQKGTEHDYEVHTAIIKNLPSSLEYVGIEAFYLDDGLEADLNAPNLYHIGERAFMGTNVRDVLIPEGVTSLREATFANDPSLRNITIDADFGAIVAADQDSTINYPQSLLDWADGDENDAHFSVVSHIIEFCRENPDNENDCWGERYSRNKGEDFRTFYSIFNKTMRESDPDTTNGQQLANESFGELTFGPNNVTPIPGSIGIFSWFNFDKVDMSQAGWKSITNTMGLFYNSTIGTLLLPEGLEVTPDSGFMYTSIDEPFALPETLKTLSRASFQWTTGTITNMLPEGVENVGNAAFYESDMSDNLVIPGSVNHIGSAAFNAGSKDVHYDTVTIMPDLTASVTENHMVHQMLWNVDLDKLTVESGMLVALERLRNSGSLSQYNEEFLNMPMTEVVLTNLPEITRLAFLGNENLEKVDASADANLRAIDEEAFLNDEKLHIFKFSPDIKNETVTVGTYAFKGTAFETMSDASSDFDLTAAHFNGADGYAFSDMPKLRLVVIPEGFSENTVPKATFANDPELAEVIVDYRIRDIMNAAFSNDDKMERIFIWGNTIVEDKNIGGYTVPVRFVGTPDDDATVSDEYGPTIPEGTDVYAYSANLTEAYVGFDGPRQDFEGTFYPLDEVIYLTSNKPRVNLNEEQDDFDKSKLKVYGMRRDGVILESDTWGVFDGGSYPRSSSSLSFEKMAGIIEENPVFGTIWDTPVPLDELSYDNVNFEEIDFELLKDPEDNSVRLVNIIYTDGYTRGNPDTDIDPNAEPEDNPIIPDPIEDLIEEITGPITLGKSIAVYVAILIAASAGVFFVLKCKQKNS